MDGFTEERILELSLKGWSSVEQEFQRKPACAKILINAPVLKLVCA